MKINYLHIILLIGFILVNSRPLLSQNIEQMIEEKPIKFSGSLSAQLLGYTTSRERPSRDPFVWTLSGSPTISIYGFNIPFSFTISQKQRDFRQPFNQFGMSPYYKWITVHAGYRNINFSRYTLAGHTFLGGGVEATPGNFRFGFIYGRFLKAVEDDSLNVEYVIPAFKRTGYSIKIGYGTSSNYVDLVLFKAKDDTSSIDQPNLSTGVIPGENLVFGLKTFQRFLRNFTIDIDFGYSIYTNNLYASDVGITKIPLKSLVTAFTTVNNSTNVNWAGNASLTYSQRFLSLRLLYRRIEPEYQSMGAYFFNNDIELITLDPSLYLFKRKLNLRGSIGYQRNNLLDTRANETYRRVNSLNINFSPVQKLNINLAYTNFRIQQKRNPLIIKDFVDSLMMKQLNTNLSFNVRYTYGSKELQQTISIGTNMQRFNEENPSVEINYSRSLSPFLVYRLNNRVSNYSIYGSLNVNDFETTVMSQSRLAFTIGGNKRFAENKFNLNSSVTFNQNRYNKENDGSTIMARARINYRVLKSHNLNFSLNYINRKFKRDGANNFTELLIRFGYSMRM